MKDLAVLTTTDFIATKIFFLRGEKEAVRRNIDRFPDDFLIELSPKEWDALRTQIATLNSGRGKHPKYPPFAFTEQGVAMLSGVLRSPRAIETNIAIMRTFVALRKIMESNKELAAKIRQLEKKYDQRFKLVFDAIQKLIKEENKIQPIGFKVGSDKKEK